MPIKTIESQTLTIKFRGKEIYTAKSKKEFEDFITKANKDKNIITKLFWMKYTFNDLKNGIKPCFLAGTPIHTIQGIQPIENIKVGDTVYCYDAIKQEVTTAQVLSYAMFKTH